MKDFLLKTKFLGAALVLVYALLIAGLAAPKVSALVKASVPTVSQEVKYFLPITIENGEVVSPKDTVLEREFISNGQNVRVVLDTRVDELDATSLSGTGFFVSKKYLYAVSPQKTEIRNLAQLPNMVINDEMVDLFADQVIQKAGKWMFISIFSGLLIFTSLSILLYTLLLAWPMSAWLKIPFSTTLRINTLVYILLALVSYVLKFNFGFIVSLILMIACHVFLVKSEKIS